MDRRRLGQEFKPAELGSLQAKGVTLAPLLNEPICSIKWLALFGYECFSS
jgi:hypothetical protein